jgi:hypothetical protein
MSERELAPILVCVRGTCENADVGTCALCHEPVVLWDAVPARRVLFCIQCFLVHADPGTPWTLHPGTLPC